MADLKKLAVLGGSSIASPLLVQEIAKRNDRPPFEVCLIGRTRDKLEKVSAAAVRVTQGADIPLKVTFETDTARGLEGADYILNQIRVGGYQARAYDERFPQQFGITGEETFGPGGMSNALRTIPVVLEYCREIEKAAPDALALNLTNPNSFIQYAVVNYSKVNMVGVCDSPVGIAENIAAMLDVPVEKLWVEYAGMHHFGWVVKAVLDGVDMMPEILNQLEKVPGLPVDVEIARAIGGIPTSYFKYYYHSNRVFEKQKASDQVRAEQLMELQDQVMADYETSKGGLPDSLLKRGAHWYGASVVPVMLAHANNANEVHIVNLVNNGTVEWMPEKAIIETQALVSGHGFTALEPAKAPLDLQAMVRLNATFEMLWVEAVVEKDYGKALRAMMLNHLVHDLDTAKAILKEIWKF
jgi:6-phospho-beta-glucosidase